MHLFSVRRGTAHRAGSTVSSASLSPRRVGFTLIELLVVIAIISILASMIFPSFARAREQARKSVCSSNLRQIGMGIAQYTQDWDELYPVGYNCYNDKTTLPNDRFVSVVLNPYIKSTQIWDCPSWAGRYTGAAENYTGNFSFVTYAVIGTLTIPKGVIGLADPANPTGPPYTAPSSLAALNEPTKYPLLYCGTGPGQTTTPTLNAHTGVNDEQWLNGSLGGTSILYADGHTKYVPMDYGKWIGVYSTPVS